MFYCFTKLGSVGADLIGNWIWFTNLQVVLREFRKTHWIHQLGVNQVKVLHDHFGRLSVNIRKPTTKFIPLWIGSDSFHDVNFYSFGEDASYEENHKIDYLTLSFFQLNSLPVELILNNQGSRPLREGHHFSTPTWEVTFTSTLIKFTDGMIELKQFFAVLYFHILPIPCLFLSNF